MKIHFTKMHGIGNDFILIDCIQQCFGIAPPLSPPYQGGEIWEGGSALIDTAKRLCHRRFGIGADQILILSPSSIADFRMKIFNADGSEVEMCGNGIRCLAKYIWDRNLSAKNILNIETLAGIIKPEKAGNLVRVDMGEPIFEPEKIPVNIPPPNPLLAKGGGGGLNSKLQALSSKPIIDYSLHIADKDFKITCVSMGNPHVIIIVDDVASFPVTYYGPMIETHSIFPRKSNVEFIQVLTRKAIKMRVWERGSGETMACGTGASAATVAGRVKGLTDSTVTVHLLGGDLLIEWADNNHVYMTGPAIKVFEGVFDL
jgi:diaminopimelate epimerase